MAGTASGNPVDAEVVDGRDLAHGRHDEDASRFISATARAIPHTLGEGR